MRHARIACEPLTNPWTVRYLPDWFPGTGFKAVGKEARDKYQISIDGPMEYVKNAMKVSSHNSPVRFFKPTATNQSGEGFSHSITSDCLSRLEDHGRFLSTKESYGMSQVLCLEVSPSLESGIHAGVSHRWCSCSRDSMLRWSTKFPIGLLTQHPDGDCPEDILLSNGSPPQSDEESPRGTGSRC
jgi:hypothetical protein